MPSSIMKLGIYILQSIYLHIHTVYTYTHTNTHIYSIYKNEICSKVQYKNKCPPYFLFNNLIAKGMVKLA